MEAPKPQETISLELENESKKYTLKITNTSNSLLINISENGNILNKEYSKDFTLSDLTKIPNAKFFKLFDDVNGVIVSLKEVFQNKKPLIKEQNDQIELKIIPTLTAMGEPTLIIPIKKADDKEIIKNLCEIVKTLQLKVNTLEEKMKNIEESSFYHRIIESKNLIGDIIKNEDQSNLICDWIGKNKTLRFQLLYKGTKDGDSREAFHKKCDNQGPNISIIESTDGQIFGGYTSKSWIMNNNNFTPDPESFLFNINNKRKYPVSNNRGLFKDVGHLCDFGGDSSANFHELWINNNYFFDGGGVNNGKGYNFTNFELSGGKNTLKIKELEVYKVIEI